MGANWNMDPQKKDYVMVKGAPDQTDSLTIPAYIRMKVKRDTWMYAPDQRYGSNFYKVVKRNSSQDATFLENLAAEALQPIIDDGRATEITVNTVIAQRSNVGMQVDITDADNQEQTIVLPTI